MGRLKEFQWCLLGWWHWKSSCRRGAQGAGSWWFCMRLSAAAAMVLRLSTVKSSSGATSSSSPGKSSAWSSSLLFRNLLRTSSKPLVVLFTKSSVCFGARKFAQLYYVAQYNTVTFLRSNSKCIVLWFLEGLKYGTCSLLLQVWMQKK